MENKIQELTEKIYREGVEKGNDEANRLISNAREEAAKIIEDARKEADAIILAARKNATEISEQEFLSNNVYYYSMDEDLMVIV